MRVIVTRPEREAAAWVQALCERGLDAVALPLVAVELCPPPAAKGPASAWAQDHPVWMFVSPNAVRGFFGQKSSLDQQQRPQAAIEEIANSRAWVTGPGTRQALLALGWPAKQVDSPGSDAAQYDSKSLWELVQPQVRVGSKVLMLQGEDASANAELGGGEVAIGSEPPLGSAWLAHVLRGAGAHVDGLPVYRRSVPQFTESQRALAIEASVGESSSGPVWLFSSSEGVRNLQQLLPGQSWAGARALATHPRIAQAAHRAGFGAVAVGKPTLESVQAALAVAPFRGKTSRSRQTGAS